MFPPNAETCPIATNVWCLNIAVVMSEEIWGLTKEIAGSKQGSKIEIIIYYLFPVTRSKGKIQFNSKLSNLKTNIILYMYVSFCLSDINTTKIF